MVLSKRERILAAATLLVMLMFVFYRFVASPFMDVKENISREKQDLTDKVRHGDRIIRQKNQMKEEWRDMVRGGLSNDPSSMESKVLHVLRQWSYDCGLSISSIKPDRNRGEDTVLREIMFNVACRGSMDSVGQLLWQIENSELPLRITEFQLGAREEDGRDMSLQLKLSTVYLPENVIPDAGDAGRVDNGGKG